MALPTHIYYGLLPLKTQVISLTDFSLSRARACVRVVVVFVGSQIK